MFKLTREIIKGGDIWKLINQETGEDMIQKFHVQEININAGMDYPPTVTLTCNFLIGEMDVSIGQGEIEIDPKSE